MPGQRTTKKLVDINLDEISGVDHPAHLKPGWMVMKSAGGVGQSDDEGGEEILVVDDVVATATELVKHHKDLTSSLEAAAGSLLSDAPDEVKAAANVLHDFLLALPDEDGEEEDGEETPANKSLFQRFAEWLRKGDEEGSEGDVADEGECPECGEELKGGKCESCGHVAKGMPLTEATKNLLETLPAIAEIEDPSERSEAIAKAVAEFVAEEEHDMSEYAERLIKAIESAFAPVDDEEPVTKADDSDAADDEAQEQDVIAKAIGDALVAQLNPFKEDLQAMREAMAKTLDRVGALEERSVVTKGLDGDDLAPSESVKKAVKEAGGEWGGFIKSLTTNGKARLS